MSRAEDEWAYDKERGLLDATGDEYKAKTGFNNATEAMAAMTSTKAKKDVTITKKLLPSEDP